MTGPLILFNFNEVKQPQVANGTMLDREDREHFYHPGAFGQHCSRRLLLYWQALYHQESKLNHFMKPMQSYG
jgi:hypothetical protein